jgi:rubrerythrin
MLLSGAAVALLAGRDALAATRTDKGSSVENDVRILNTALGAEYQAVAAYQLGLDSRLLETSVAKLAAQFQAHHKEHADLLAKTIGKLGGKAVSPQSKYSFPAESLKQQADVLRFAAGLEHGAVSAYLGAVPVFDNRDLAKAAASILGDEAMHWAVLRHAVGEDPIPGAFLS